MQHAAFALGSVLSHGPRITVRQVRLLCSCSPLIRRSAGPLGWSVHRMFPPSPPPLVVASSFVFLLVFATFCNAASPPTRPYLFVVGSSTTRRLCYPLSSSQRSRSIDISRAAATSLFCLSARRKMVGWTVDPNGRHRCLCICAPRWGRLCSSCPVCTRRLIFVVSHLHYRLWKFDNLVEANFAERTRAIHHGREVQLRRRLALHGLEGSRSLGLEIRERGEAGNLQWAQGYHLGFGRLQIHEAPYHG